MKTPQLIERLKHNLTIKIFCFVIAFFIYIFYNISTLDTKVFSIPLEIQQEGAVVITNTPTHFVRVTVKGKPEDIVQISENDFSALVDLNHHLEKGSYSLPVLLYLSKQASLFSPLEFSCKPERIKLDIDKKITSYIPLEATFTGSPAKGYEVLETKIEPAFLEVWGPEEIILSIDEFKTKEVSIENASASFTKSVDIINTNSFVSMDLETKASVRVSMGQIFEEKKFQSNNASYINLKENLIVEESFPLYTLRLRGFINDIERYNLNSYSVFIDLSEIEEEGVYELPFEFNIPNNFEVLSIEPQTVLLTVKENTMLAIED